MSERFSDLKKVPKEPAMRILALANMKLNTRLGTPANAPVPDVLAFLDEQPDKIEAVLDMLRLLASSLPQAAEAWVRKPSDETRTIVREKLEVAEPDDPTSLASVTAVFCDGKLGAGDLAQYDAPVGASQGAAFGMNVTALAVAEDGFLEGAQHLIDRALDLARGGNGKATHLSAFRPTPPPEDEDEEMEEEETAS